jgi:hypothetical protein
VLIELAITIALSLITRSARVAAVRESLIERLLTGDRPPYTAGLPRL